MEPQFIVTLSWDDGSIADLRLCGLMTKYGLKGTFYVPKTYRRKGLTSKDIREIDTYQEIGAHSLDHIDLTRIQPAEMEQQVKGSKEYLEDLLGRQVLTFSYPRCKYNEQVKHTVKDSGFAAARTCIPGHYTLPDDPFAWHVTLNASNCSPRLSSSLWLKNRLTISSLFSWEKRAMELFDFVAERRGIYHIWGHSWEFEENAEWEEIERVFEYISKRSGVLYCTNGDIFDLTGSANRILR